MKAAATLCAPELARLRPRNSIGLLFSTSCIALTGLGLFVSNTGSTTEWLLAQCLLAIVFLQWFVAMHEAGHCTLFRSRRANDFIGQIAGFFCLIPFGCWKQVHAKHHKWTGWQDLDATTASLVPRSMSRAERAMVNMCWRYWIPAFSVVYRFNNFWNLARIQRFYPDKKSQQKLLVNTLALLGAYSAVIYVVGFGQTLYLVGPALLLTLVIQDPLILSQHTHIPQHLSSGKSVRPFSAVEQESFTRSLRFPTWFARHVLLNMNAHELHHMYVQVPGYYLTRIDYLPHNEIEWWDWLRKAKRMKGEVFLFQNRKQSRCAL